MFCSFRHRQAVHHLDKNALVAPAFPAVIQRFHRAIFLQRIAPPEPVAIDENDADQHTPIIYTLAAMALGVIGLKTSNFSLFRQNKLLISQAPVRPSDHYRQFKSMGPDPRRQAPTFFRSVDMRSETSRCRRIRVSRSVSSPNSNFATATAPSLVKPSVRSSSTKC